MRVRLVLLNVCCANITKEKCDCQFLLVMTTSWYLAFFFIWIFSLVYTGWPCIINLTAFKSLSLIILCVWIIFAWVCVCAAHACRDQKRMDTSGLELQTQLWVNMRVLGIKHGSSRRAASALNYWTLSPSPMTAYFRLSCRMKTNYLFIMHWCTVLVDKLVGMLMCLWACMILSYDDVLCGQWRLKSLTFSLPFIYLLMF